MGQDRMKLTFPNGEHEPVTLGEGITAIGTSAECPIVLAAPGIALRHAEIHMRNGQALVRVPDPRNVVVLNGRQVTQDMAIKPGDLLLFAKVGCQVMAPPERAAPTPPPRPATGTGEESDGRTRIRQALPKYMLRGVSGSTFGKTYALVGTMTVGRQQDCDISIPGDEISRHHAKLQVLPDGVMVEDMGSANGTFINDKRVHSGVIKPGEELRLDTVRFLLMAPGMEVNKPAAAPPPPAPEPKSGPGAGLWVGVAVVVLAAAAGAAKFFGLF
ncbi:FHA domain-containing protein [Tahibacter amnicola]|uniref:FHA domain-containing protein n=1 Tax=Tahibacter amnicola TaxID=2976241 RepID=A0ABY6BKA0_9GAMM|nr:FHA domain-containing protein [Tahibacter amnicola]UXI69500.1 FHA domain-containing protein [Tahibacter amnicola]